YLEPDQRKKAERLTRKYYENMNEQARLKNVNVKIVETRLEDLRSALDIIDKKSSRYFNSNVLVDKRV
ncbi:MAG: hypothetical protein WC332_01215, partial [Clostridia bacterium]